MDTFLPLAEQPSLNGTVRGNSGCCYAGDPNHTEYWSTCDATQDGGASCNYCQSDGGCLSEGGGCIPLYTYEESYCVCTNEYSCECAFSEASNCHRCTGP